MKEYIEKSKAIMYAQDYVSDNEKNVLLRRLYDEPAADVKPVVHAHWVCVPHKRARICSHCACDEPYKFADEYADVYNFCPNCGADMRSNHG